MLKTHARLGAVMVLASILAGFVGYVATQNGYSETASLVFVVFLTAPQVVAEVWSK